MSETWGVVIVGGLTLVGVVAREVRLYLVGERKAEQIERDSMRRLPQPQSHDDRPFNHERRLEGRRWMEERGAILEQLRVIQVDVAGLKDVDFDIRDRLQGIVLKFERHLERLDGQMERAQGDIREMRTDLRDRA